MRTRPIYCGAAHPQELAFVLRVPIQLGFSHAVGAAEFGLFASGAPPSASARWVVVGCGLGPIEKVGS